jgi:predicted transcriptional regulator
MAKLPLPTDAELAILTVLWRLGPATVRDVHEALHPTQGTGYTTVLKLMQLMAQKGLLARDESQRSHVYRPATTEAQTQRRLLGDLMERAFSGSAGQLVLRALSVKRASPGELAEIRELLDGLGTKEDK